MQLFYDSVIKPLETSHILWSLLQLLNIIHPSQSDNKVVM